MSLSVPVDRSNAPGIVAGVIEDARARQWRRRLWAATALMVVAGIAVNLALSRLSDNGPRATGTQLHAVRTHGTGHQVVPIGITYHTVNPASFRYLPKGWSTLPGPTYLLDRRGTSAEAMALSWRYTPNPNGPAGALPRNGVEVWVLMWRSGPATVNLCRTTPHFPDYPARSFPLRLPRTTSHTLEGAPEVKEDRVFGRYADYYNFEVRVEIAPHASPHAWQLATWVVAGIRFPAWPRLATC